MIGNNYIRFILLGKCWRNTKWCSLYMDDHHGVLLLSVLAQLVFGDSFITVRTDTQKSFAVALMQREVDLCHLLVAKRKKSTSS